jgi:hypothetical protein
MSKKNSDDNEMTRSLLRAKALDHKKKFEEVRLHTLDVNRGTKHQRDLKQWNQDHLLKTEYAKFAFNTEVNH